MTRFPSGKQFELESGGQRATVVEVGGGLRDYRVADRPVLDGFSTAEPADGGRGQPLLPWPNRILDGMYDFDGQQLQLPIEEVERHNAMHGLTRWQNWVVLQQDANLVRLGLSVYPRSGYPFLLDLEIAYSLRSDGLHVRTSARNAGDGPPPFAAGQHPYLTVGTPFVDEANLQIPAKQHLEMDSERLVPTGVSHATAGTSLDFLKPRAIGGCTLDDCFTNLERDETGRAYVTLSDPSTGNSATLWMSREYRYVQVFTGDTLRTERKRRGLAIEPMTSPPNAFRTGTDLIELQPEQTIALEWGITTTGPLG
jgi:galactose mutarotase-like enzyme